MKTTVMKSLVLAGLVLAVPGGQGQSTPAVLDIGISPHLDVPTSTVAFSNIAHLLISLPAGSQFRCGDAMSPSLVVRGVVPKLPFDSPAAQAKALAAELRRLRAWLQTDRSASPLAGTGCLNLPRYLRWVGENRLATNNSGTVLLVGDVLYRTVESGFSFTTNRLAALENFGLAEARSPWGCLDRQSLLTGLSLHWFFPKDTMPHEPFAVAAREFFSTYLACQGGTLGSLTTDWATVTNALSKALPAPRAVDLAQLAGPNPQPRMREVSVREVAEPAAVPPKAPALVTPKPAAPQPVVQSDPPPPTMPPTPPTPATNAPTAVAVVSPPVTIPQNVNRAVSSVGILWAGANDLDISLRSKPGTPAAADELFYGTPSLTNALGRYLADHRSGGHYEWIELPEGMDAASLSTHEVWVNHFAGRGPVELTVAIADHGRVMATRKLTITGDGDHRRHATRESSASWLKLPVTGMLQAAVCR